MKRPSKKAEEKLRAALLEAIDRRDKEAQQTLGLALTKMTCPFLWKAFTSPLRSK